VATATIAAFAKKYKQNICIDHRRLATEAASQSTVVEPPRGAP
jgi:hypothetical protein